MNRRNFSRNVIYSSFAIPFSGISSHSELSCSSEIKDDIQGLPVREFDVVIAGGGTAGVMAAVASARQGAKTVLIEAKGYPGGTVVEGGTALHSYFNLWKAFPGVEKRQLVKGLAQEIIDRLLQVGGTTGHADTATRYNYDCVCTAIDTELYKLKAFEMLNDAGVFICVNTLVAGAVRKGTRLEGVITQSRMGREYFKANSFVDSTAYGDLSAYAGADFIELNDHPVCNSMGLGNVNIEKVYDFLKVNNATGDIALGLRSGKESQIIRMGMEGTGSGNTLPTGFVEGIRELGSGT